MSFDFFWAGARAHSKFFEGSYLYREPGALTATHKADHSREITS